jgi:peptide chain release factor 2
MIRLLRRSFSVQELLQKSTEHVSEIQRLFTFIDSKTDWDGIRQKLEKIQSESSTLEWNSKEIQLQKEASKLKDDLDEYDQIRDKFTNSRELLELIKNELDVDLLKDLHAETCALEPIVQQYFLKTLLNEEADKSSCFIEIRAGAGGTESCDWVVTVSRMYTKWAASRGYSCILMF